MKKVYLLSMLLCMISLVPLMAQDMQIAGKVTEAGTDEALAGVNVIVSGTTTGTVTDIDGNYTLTVPQGSTLVFSFVGFLTKEVPVGNQT
ncbi:MAG: carboxypeptidase-like regulatory domain-containing protein, partial [Cyclobacteriaceae bacterium]